MIVQESQYNNHNHYSNSSKKEGAIYLVLNAAATKFILMKIARPAQRNGYHWTSKQDYRMNVNTSHEYRL